MPLIKSAGWARMPAPAAQTQFTPSSLRGTIQAAARSIATTGKPSACAMLVLWALAFAQIELSDVTNATYGDVDAGLAKHNDGYSQGAYRFLVSHYPHLGGRFADQFRALDRSEALESVRRDRLGELLDLQADIAREVKNAEPVAGLRRRMGL